jgi:DNA-binding transcriptional regulator YiaG
VPSRLQERPTPIGSAHRSGRRIDLARAMATPAHASDKSNLPWLGRWLSSTRADDNSTDTHGPWTEPVESEGVGPDDAWLSAWLAAFTASETPAVHATDVLQRHEAETVTAAPPVDEGMETALASSAAVAAVADLRRWLNLNLPQVAALSGTSRSAVLYWKRKRASPRPGAARNVYRVHALVRALRHAVAPQPALEVLRRTANEANDSAFDLLVAGRYDEAESLLRPLIFRHPDPATPNPRIVHWPEENAEAPSVPPLQLRPPVRRAVRVTLTR